MKIRYNEDAEVVARLRSASRSPTRSSRATAIADFTIKRNKR